MKKVSVFYSRTEEELENRINDALQLIGAKVEDIKFSTAAYAFGGYVFSAMIIYED